MARTRLTEHFFLDEFLVSDTADRSGIANTPTADHLANIGKVLAPGLEKARSILGARANSEGCDLACPARLADLSEALAAEGA